MKKTFCLVPAVLMIGMFSGAEKKRKPLHVYVDTAYTHCGDDNVTRKKNPV